MTTPKKKRQRQSIALVGFRGSGKTSVAREVARIVDGDFVDTDDLIAARASKTITEIFADDGEAVFRRYESEAITETLKDLPAVISLGGGAVLDPDSIDRVRAACFVVWLTAPAEILWQRISGDAGTALSRPALTSVGGLEEVRSVLAARENLYRAASHATVDTNGRDVARIAEDIVALARKSAGC